MTVQVTVTFKDGSNQTFTHETPSFTKALADCTKHFGETFTPEAIVGLTIQQAFTCKNTLDFKVPYTPWHGITGNPSILDEVLTNWEVGSIKDGKVTIIKENK